MSFIMYWQLRTTLLACLGLCACTPDAFEYGGPGSHGPSNCDTDDCPAQCPAGTKPGPSGSCEPICGDWQSSLEIPVPGALAVFDTKVYATGTSAGDEGRPPRAMLQRVEGCTGALTQAALPLSDQGSSLEAVAPQGAALIVAGSSDGVVTFAELDSTTLVEKAAHPLPGLPADARVVDLSLGSSGAWLAGQSKAGGSFVGRLAGGKICSGAVSGVVHTIAALSDGALVVSEAGGKLSLVRLGAAACNTSTATSPPLALPGADSASARDLLVIDSAAWVVGHARAGATAPFGFVAAVDVSSGAVMAFAQSDVLLESITAVGSHLYAGGSRGPAQPGDDHSGVAALVAWALPLENGAEPIWSQTVDAHRVQALGHDARAVFALTATGTPGSPLASFALLSPPR